MFEKLAVGLLLAGFSTHHTTNHAPAEGYNENHKVKGVEVVQDKEGVAFGVSGALFKDSFDKSSKWLMGTAQYNKDFEILNTEWRAGVGSGVGHLQTSYYNGAGIMPFVELENKDSGLYLKTSHVPQFMQGVDAVTMGTIGWRKRF